MYRPLVRRQSAGWGRSLPAPPRLLLPYLLCWQRLPRDAQILGEEILRSGGADYHVH